MGDATGLEALKEGERKCLRLAAAGHTNDEIARELGHSSGYVANQILSARQKLGGLSRRAAGRALLAHEGVQPSQVQPLHLASEPPVIEAAQADQPSHGVGGHSEVREERVPFEIEPVTLVDHFAGVLGPRNRMTKAQRLACLLLAAAVVAIGTFAALAAPFLLQVVHAS